MDQIKKHTIQLEDGRKADKVVYEENGPSGESRTVSELWVEPVIEKKLSQRVVEHRKPIVVSREIETVDDNGEVVERKIESIEPQPKMSLVEHIQTTNSVSALSTPDCDCFVTKEDLQDSLMAVVRAIKESSVEEEAPQVSGLQAMVGEKLSVNQPSWFGDGTLVSYGLGGLVLALVATLGYVAFVY